MIEVAVCIEKERWPDVAGRWRNVDRWPDAAAGVTFRRWVTPREATEDLAVLVRRN